MKLTRGQLGKFRREWDAACQENGWTDDKGVDFADREWHRKALLARAGFSSLKDVTRVGGFDAVLAQLSALLRPADLNAQMKIAGNAKRVLIHSILQRSRGQEWAGIAGDRWRSTLGENPLPDDLEKLSETDLRQLRDTLAARASSRGDSRHQQPRPDFPQPDRPF